MAKANRASLLQEIAQALSALPYQLSGPTQQASADDLYEVFLLLTVMRAGQSKGYSVHLAYDSAPSETAPVKQPKHLCVRSAPGFIYSQTSTSGHPYTHPVLTKSGHRSLGLYVGVRVEGMSGVLSEADVLVMKESVAASRVSHAQSPQAWEGDVLLHIEAKNYAKAVDLATARAFVGMAADFHFCGCCNRSLGVSILAADQFSNSAEKFVNLAPLMPTVASPVVFSGGRQNFLFRLLLRQLP